MALGTPGHQEKYIRRLFSHGNLGLRTQESPGDGHESGHVLLDPVVSSFSMQVTFDPLEEPKGDLRSHRVRDLGLEVSQLFEPTEGGCKASLTSTVRLS